MPREGLTPHPRDAKYTGKNTRLMLGGGRGRGGMATAAID